MIGNDSMSRGSKKNFNFIDNVKFFACLSVIAVHFRLNYMSGLPKEAMGLKAKLFFSIDYQLFITCVPLFMIATGFLMTNKKFNKTYFQKMFHVVLLYIVCSLLTLGINYFVFHKPFGLGQVISDIMNFRLIEYSWYVEMYIGLLFFIPLLNKIIANSSSKELRSFILALLIAIALPGLINSIPEMNTYFHLPNAFGAAYPILYYLIGAYFRVGEKEDDKVNLLLPTVIMLFMIFLGIAINMSHATPYVGGVEGGYASLLVVVQSICLFYLFKHCLNKSNFVIRKIAKLTLPIYLMSFVVDSNSYSHFIKPFTSTKYMLMIFVTLVVAHFLISILLAMVANSANNLLIFLGEKIFKGKKRKI